MSAISKGDYVVVTAPHVGGNVSTHGNQAVDVGDELLVTSVVGGGFLNVRRGPDGYVFRVPRSKVVLPDRQVGEVPVGALDADDPRIAWIFEDAARLAKRLGFCKEYERITEMLGVPGRERVFHITLINTDGVKVTAEVTARSQKLAEERVRAGFRAQSPLAVTDGGDA